MCSFMFILQIEELKELHLSRKLSSRRTRSRTCTPMLEDRRGQSKAAPAEAQVKPYPKPHAAYIMPENCPIPQDAPSPA